MIEAEFRIVTPLFMGGGDPENPELRLPGIKGALRFWWRALAWSWCEGDLSRIRDLEGRIFGSTEHGQSRVIIDLKGERAEQKDDNFFGKNQGLMYLGYGLVDKGKLTRKYQEQPRDARLRIRIRPGGSGKAPDESEIADQISKALIAMGLFGGLGSRSRRGFGSFNLTGLNVNGEKKFSCPGDRSRLEKEIKRFFEDLKLREELPEYTAFSSKTEVYVLEDNSANPLDLLNEVGRRMQKYRLGSMGKQRNGSSASNFENDTRIAKSALRGTVTGHPRRLFFGLPHNYHFKNSEETLEIRPEKHDRRASPLLIHVQELNKGYAAVAALMPARFLPQDEMILMRPQKDAERGGVRSSGDGFSVRLDETGWTDVISGFLESWERVI